MRDRRLTKNSIASLLLQITTVISGFVLPRLILQTYGSNTNGLVNSVSQFLHIITFMDLGVGAVVQSALYKPLADEDFTIVSKIMSSTTKYFKTLGRILVVYVVLLVFIYPVFLHQSIGFTYLSTLIIAIAINYFSQYYFGVANQFLLMADQKGYVYYDIQIVTVIINTILCAILINLGATMQVVKFATSTIFLLRPVLLRVYVDKHYAIDRSIQYDEEPIKQKWNGIAQHISSFVLDGTDHIVLTLFSTLSAVSIYSVYHLVVYGIKNLIISVTSGGLQARLGELYAKNEQDRLVTTFSWAEWLIHSGTTFLFTCTYVLILPFVAIYTKGIEDVNYIQPAFAALIVLANYVHCLRLPYHIMIKAAGKYKETQSSHIIATLINISISIITVNYWGLIGVAVGTLIAMLYQTIWMANYNSKYILHWPIRVFVKHILVDFISIVGCCCLTSFIRLRAVNYKAWCIMALECMIVCGILSLSINLVANRNKMTKLFSVIRKDV